MTQASKETAVKHAILSALERNSISHPNGMRYYDLYRDVKGDAGSIHTYEKYLKQLEEREHAIERGPDPTDSRAKLLKLVPISATRTLTFLESLKRIQEITAKGMTPISFKDWKEQREKNPPQGETPLNEDELHYQFACEFLNTTFHPVTELVKIAHSTYVKMMEKKLRQIHPDAKNPLDIYLRVQGNMIEQLLHEKVQELRRIASAERKRREKEGALGR
jgi:hypothetical protein